MVPSWLQQIIGPLVVATVIGLVGDRYRLGDTIDGMATTLLTQKIYIDQFNEFRTAGERFTYEDGEILRENMIQLVAECKSAATDIRRIELDIARLPPPKWQDRIMRMESQFHELRALIHLGRDVSERSDGRINLRRESSGDGLLMNPMDLSGHAQTPVKN